MWSAITEAHTLRPDQLRVLEDACGEADLIDELQAARKDQPLMVKGSMGQLVASPLISEVRQHRATLNALLRSLKLPDGDVAEGRSSATSEQARAAARARWSRKSA